MKNLIFYSSYYEAIKELPAEEQGKVYKAVVDYAMEQIEPNLSGISRAIFILIKPTLDASIKNYENGKRGGRPKSETQTEYKTQVKTQSETRSITQDITQNETEMRTDIIFENEKEKKNISMKENSLTREKESEASSLSTRTQKHKNGSFKNVLLTDEEYHQLISEPDGEAAIEYFSNYREMKGYKCKNDYLAIRKWAFKAVNEERQRNQKIIAKPIMQNTQKVSSEEAVAWK